MQHNIHYRTSKGARTVILAGRSKAVLNVCPSMPSGVVLTQDRLHEGRVAADQVELPKPGVAVGDNNKRGKGIMKCHPTAASPCGRS